jgi:hypothetical protein
LIRQAAFTVLVAFLAASGAGAEDTVTIQGAVVTGLGQVNVAAGVTNQQANAALMSAGRIATGFGTVSQTMGDAPDSKGRLSSSVAPNSFAGSSGWLAINGAAGSGNQQANLAIIALGTTGAAISDTALSQARASHEPTGGSDTGAGANDRHVAVGDGAFANSSGLIQVSLIGGDRNSSANVLALSATGGTGK